MTEPNDAPAVLTYIIGGNAECWGSVTCAHRRGHTDVGTPTSSHLHPSHDLSVFGTMREGHKIVFVAVLKCLCHSRMITLQRVARTSLLIQHKIADLREVHATNLLYYYISVTLKLRHKNFHQFYLKSTLRTKCLCKPRFSHVKVAVTTSLCCPTAEKYIWGGEATTLGLFGLQ